MLDVEEILCAASGVRSCFNTVQQCSSKTQTKNSVCLSHSQCDVSFTQRQVAGLTRDLRSFMIRFDFESYVAIRYSIRIDGPIRKFSNSPRCQSPFIKKRLVVVKFAFKVDFGSKISVQQHCLTRFMTELK